MRIFPIFLSFLLTLFTGKIMACAFYEVHNYYLFNVVKNTDTELDFFPQNRGQLDGLHPRSRTRLPTE